MATAKTLKIEYTSKNNIHENQIRQAIELLQDQEMPKNLDAEAAVIGAIMLEASSKEVIKSIRMLSPDDFYDDAHQRIFRSIKKLFQAGRKVDLITVSEEIKKEKDFEADDIDKILNATNKVANASHIVDHVLTILDKSLRRDAIIRSHIAVRQLYDPTSDVFDVRNTLSDDLRVMPYTSFLRVRSGDERIIDGMNMPTVKKMAGSLWRSGELVFLFAGPKRGKSIFAVQIADSISKGVPVFPGILENECPPQRVGYIDFELMDNEFFERYTNNDKSEKYSFSENLYILDRNPDFNDYEKPLDRVVIQNIEDAIQTYELEVVVIDNITWLSTISSSDTQAALDLMRSLDRIRQKYSVSMMVLAHTPKINSIVPLDENMMGGSKHLSNFAQAVIGIGKSSIDPNIRYIKECVRRNGRIHFDEDNVIEVEIVKEDNFLKYQFISLSSERKHLEDPNDKQVQLQIIEEAGKLYRAGGKSWQEIYFELSIRDTLGWTERHFRRKVTKELERSDKNLLFGDGGGVSKIETPF